MLKTWHRRVCKRIKTYGVTPRRGTPLAPSRERCSQLPACPFNTCPTTARTMEKSTYTHARTGHHPQRKLNWHKLPTSLYQFVICRCQQIGFESALANKTPERRAVSAALFMNIGHDTMPDIQSKPERSFSTDIFNYIFTAVINCRCRPCNHCSFTIPMGLCFTEFNETHSYLFLKITVMKYNEILSFRLA